MIYVTGGLLINELSLISSHSIPAMQVTQVTANIYNVAKFFQINNNLDLTDIPSMLCHDFIHATLGLGVTTADEELVESIELVLEHGSTWNVAALEMARSLPAELRNLYKFGDV